MAETHPMTTPLAPIINEEPRLVPETGVDARVTTAIEPILNAEGYRLVRVRLSGMNGMTLQIMAERADGTMMVEDCESISRLLSPLLDVEDIIDRAYHLEVSSPGIDRPLVRASDFGKWRGHIAKVETSIMIEGKRRFRGTITDAGSTSFTLERDKPSMNDVPIVEIPYDTVSDARLILTDELIEASLKASKKAKQVDGFDEDDAPNEKAPKTDNSKSSMPNTP
ncbi:MAG: ribosome maturation factor RimP [Pseudomonadota bacterium]